MKRKGKEKTEKERKEDKERKGGDRRKGRSGKALEKLAEKKEGKLRLPSVNNNADVAWYAGWILLVNIFLGAIYLSLCFQQACLTG